MIIKALQIWNDHALKREGCKNVVYLDSLGKPTGGIGHLIKPEDNLGVGQNIPDEKIEEWFSLDTADALSISLKHWKDIGIHTTEFLAALISVNFQLGDFSQKFKNSYQLIKERRFNQAIENLKTSLWARQTPKRVDDFINQLRSLK